MIFAMFTGLWLAIMGRSGRERKPRTPSHPKYKKWLRAGEVPQGKRDFATNIDDLSLIPRTHMAEENGLLQVVL